MNKRNPLEEKINIELQDSNTYNALVEIALLTDSYLFFDYEKKEIMLKSKDDPSFDKGFQLSPYFNMQEMDVSLTGETLYPILHVEGGVSDTGLLINLVPALSYHQWEALLSKWEDYIDGLDSGEKEDAIQEMRDGEFFKNNKEDLGVEHWDEKILMQMEHVPYIDSFLAAFDYFEEQDFVDPEDSEYKAFLEDLYLNLTRANLDLQAKNIKNILIEEQIRRIQRKIEATAEEVAADTTDDYEQEISKLDSLFLEKGGRETEKEAFTDWVDGDDPIEGTNLRPRDVYLDKWIFVKISAEEYFSLLKDEVDGESVEYNNYKGFKIWDKESPLIGDGDKNPKKVHSANQKYFYSEEIDSLHGFKVRLKEENTKGETRDHIDDLDFSGVDAGDKTIAIPAWKTLSDPIDDEKWETFDDDRTYDKKEYEVSLTQDPNTMSVIEPFANKIYNSSNNKVEIVAKGLQRIPTVRFLASYSGKRFPIEEDMWHLPGEIAVEGYYKVEEDLELQDPESNNQWRGVGGNRDLYYGWTSPMLSYPQKEDIFSSWIEDVIGTNEVEYYELNDRFTLALVQGVDAFLFDKNDIYGSTRTNNRIGVTGKEVYRVFFYSDTKFALVYGDSSGSAVRLYDVSGSSPRTNIGIVSLDGVHPNLVTGGYYRDDIVTIGNIEWRTSSLSNPGRYTGTDFEEVDGIGTREDTWGWLFSTDSLEEDAKELFTNIPTRILNDTDQARIKAWSKNTFSVEGRVFAAVTSRGSTQWRYYRFNVTHNVSSETKEAIYYKSGGIIMARTWGTWEEREVEKKAWQYAQFADLKDDQFSGGYGTETNMIVAVEKSLFLKRYSQYDPFLMYAFTGGDTTPKLSRDERLAWTKPPYIVATNSGSWYDTAHIFDGDKKITSVRSSDLRIGEETSSIKLLYSGKNSFLGVLWRGTHSVGVYYRLNTSLSDSTLYVQTDKEFPQSISINGDIVFVPLRDRFYFKRILSNNSGPAWRVDKNHQRQFAPSRPNQKQLEEAVTSRNLNKGTRLYHGLKDKQEYEIREMVWGMRSLPKTIIPNSGADFLIKGALIERTKRGFDLLRYNTPYLDLLDVYKGYNYLRDLNYSYLREIDYYIQERKRIEDLIEAQGEGEDGFYDTELEAIEAEIGDIDGYLIQDVTQEEGEGEEEFWEEEGEFWKYKTKEEYIEATGRKDIDHLAWKDYSLLLKKNEISFGDSSEMWAVEVRANGYETGVVKIRANEAEVDVSAFWDTVIFDYGTPRDLTLSTDDEVLIRSVIAFNPESPSLIKTMNAIIDWSNYRDSSGNSMNKIQDEITPEHAKVFFSQPERFTGASTESKQFGYATKKGRLSLKQERFQMFMEEREKVVLDAKRTSYPLSTHGQVVQARKEKEKIWFDMKKNYPELLLEGYYTNETENDSFNLMAQALENYKYHNRPSEEYGITYIDVQDLEGESSLVEVGDRVEVKSRMLRDLMPNDKKEQKKLQVTNITRELRDPSNIQLEVSPIKKSNLSEKLLDLIKRK